MENEEPQRKFRPGVEDLLTVLCSVSIVHWGYKKDHFPNEEIWQAVESFIGNHWRLQCLLRLPTSVSLYAFVYERDTGRTELIRAINDPKNKPIIGKLIAETNEGQSRWLYEGPRPNFGAADVVPHDVAGMADFLPHDSPRIVHEFYCALLIQTWALFETLAEDLWVLKPN